MFRFDKKYGLIFLAILIVEIIIALFVKNPTIRGSIGDVLVVILIYCFIQTFLNFDKAKTIICIGIFAILIEISQAFNLVEKLGLQDNKLVSTVMGTTFDMNDIWAYVAGCAVVYMLEFSNENTRPKKRKLF
ncbi:ribosomal maturation YjgA family protein [Moheibacter sediminis]|uniref:DUF2809 domain-containing protein n=1 Tax=Moheibacter sediminis TaxID=1434700 RepID=A0A1W2C889_9FLAO|nr:DUF2809 domain-containing protein [Moheibacter sediminis]SMC81465.1 Protein of unknown function [Moheibacter sediminis]